LVDKFAESKFKIPNYPNFQIKIADSNSKFKFQIQSPKSKLQIQISNPNFVKRLHLFTQRKFGTYRTSSKTSNNFFYPFHQIGNVISHKKYSTIKQIPKRKSFLVWTNVKGTDQIQNPNFQNSNSVAMAKNYLQHT
jgi:hypothetical protein